MIVAYFLFFVIVTVHFFGIRFCNCTELRVLVNSSSIIDISIENISTCGSCLLLFLRLLLLFLCKRTFKFLLFLLEINESLSLFFDIFWIIPIVFPRSKRSTAFVILIWDNLSSSSITSLRNQSIFSLHTSMRCIWNYRGSTCDNRTTGITSSKLILNNSVLFFRSKFSSFFCLFNLDSNINCLSIEVFINSIHIFRMIRLDILSLFF